MTNLCVHILSCAIEIIVKDLCDYCCIPQANQKNTNKKFQSMKIAYFVTVI